MPKAFLAKAVVLLVAVPFVLSSYLFLVVRPGAPSSVLAPSSRFARVLGLGWSQVGCLGLPPLHANLPESAGQKALERWSGL